MLRRARAYTLLEILIVLAVLAGAVVGVLRLFAMSDVRAATQKEQTSISALVDAVRGVYAASPSYQGVDMALVAKEASLRGVLRASGGLPVSAFSGDLLTVRAATVRVPDDAFSITVGGLDRKACAAVIPALAGETTQVSTISGGNIQTTPHRVPDAAAIATACAGGFFAKGTGGVVLVYYRPRATGGAVARGPACAVSCSPQTESQTIACATGLVGQITQTRSDTCSTGACPVPVIGAWTTVSSSCAPPAAPVVPVVPPPVKDPPLACAPGVQVRSLGCPAPQIGQITQRQAITCDVGGGQHVGPWTTVSSSCAAPPPVCTPTAIEGADACAAGQFGQVSWVQETTCVGATAVVGAKTITGSSCAPIGTCRPSTAPDGQRNVACAAGQFGQITQSLEKSSTCASATAVPAWGPSVVVNSTGACAACPSPATATQTQWAAVDAGCPAGQTGGHTYEQEQSRSQTTSYDCAGAPVALPAPTVSAWSAWADVAGSTKNDVNTCAAGACYTPSVAGVVMFVGGEPANGIGPVGVVQVPIASVGDCAAWLTAGTPTGSRGGFWGYYMGSLPSATAFCAQMLQDIAAQQAGKPTSGQTIDSNYEIVKNFRVGSFGNWYGIYVSDILARPSAGPAIAPFNPATGGACAGAAPTCSFTPNSGRFFISRPHGVGFGNICQAVWTNTCSDGTTTSGSKTIDSAGPSPTVSVPAEGGTSISLTCPATSNSVAPSTW